MPKAKLSPKKLTRQFILQRSDLLRIRQETAVPVPSFGKGMTVNVRGLTVADKNMLAVFQLQGRDPMSIIAALCAVDDDGVLVFGDDKADAITTVETLPEYMRYDIAAIAAAAVKLSGRAVIDGDDDPEETAVENAEKN